MKRHVLTIMTVSWKLGVSCCEKRRRAGAGPTLSDTLIDERISYGSGDCVNEEPSGLPKSTDDERSSPTESLHDVDTSEGTDEVAVKVGTCVSRTFEQFRKGFAKSSSRAGVAS